MTRQTASKTNRGGARRAKARSTAARQRLILWIAVIGVALVAAILSASALGPATGAIWFDDLGFDPPPEQDEIRVVESLAQIVLGTPGAALASVPDAEPRIVFVSLSDGETPARIVMGRGRGLAAAVANAAEQAARLTDGRPPAWVKIDVVGQVDARPDFDFTQTIPYERSLWGLAPGETAAFLPEELVARTLVNSSGKVQMDNLRRALAERGVETADAILDRSAPLYQFSTRGYFSDGGPVIRLYRGHRMLETVPREELLVAARAGGDYLARAVGDDGRFEYRYDPADDALSDDYNIVRHAGTVWAMLDLYGATGDEALLAAARRAVAYLVMQVQPCAAPSPLVTETVACLVEDDEVKLGGNGLAIVALARYVELTGETRYADVAEALGKWIVGAQMANGDFVHQVLFSSGAITNFRSAYYSGEAILGLIRLYQIRPDERWLDVAEAAALYLIETRDAGKSVDELTHDHWLLYALNDLYRLRPDERYLAHANRIVESIIAWQNRDGVPPDWIGGYDHYPRSTPAAARTEGLCAAYALQRDQGLLDESRATWEAIMLGLRFQLQTQFRPESAMYFPQPRRILGAFRRGLTEGEIRIDYVQHNISSLLCADANWPE